MAVEPGRLRRGVRLPGDKARAAVVLRSDALAPLPYAAVVAFMTTAHAGPDLRLPVAPTPDNGLQQPSFAMVDWLQTIRAAHVGEVVGQLDPITLEAITGRVAVVLGMGEPRSADHRRIFPGTIPSRAITAIATH